MLKQKKVIVSLTSFPAAMIYAKDAINSILDQGISGDLFLSGLSSFFRDILVSKNKVSHKLLNLDDTKINKLSDLGSDLNYDFLIEYIAILNEAEINFQKSINQRLLV